MTFPVRQEEDEVASGRVVRVAVIGVLVGVAAILAAGLLLFGAIGSVRGTVVGPGELARSERGEVAGALQTPLEGPAAGLELRDRQRRELEKWGWVDRRAGIAKIPIDRAMRIVQQEASR